MTKGKYPEHTGREKKTVQSRLSIRRKECKERGASLGHLPVAKALREMRSRVETVPMR